MAGFLRITLKFLVGTPPINDEHLLSAEQPAPQPRSPSKLAWLAWGIPPLLALLAGLLTYAIMD